MSYSYKDEKQKIFTEDGVYMLLKIRDNVKMLLMTAGAFQCDRAFRGVSGDSFKMLACIDYLEEEGTIVKVERANIATQNQVYTGA